MDTSEIVSQIDVEIARLQQARDLLQSTLLNPVLGHRRFARVIPNIVSDIRPRKPLSVEARAKISEAQRRRWAKSKIAR
jgi:hypothetical protein